jgi:hypothetical protein
METLTVSPEEWITETVLVETTRSLETLRARLEQLGELSRSIVQQPVHLLQREDREAFADLLVVVHGCETAHGMLRDSFASLQVTALAQQLRLHAGLCQLSQLIERTHRQLSAVNEAILICGHQHRDPAFGLTCVHVH